MTDFKTQMNEDISEVFLQEFSQLAVFKSENTVKNVSIQFFEEALEKTEHLYTHIWCNYDDVSTVEINDTFTIDNIVYGVIDFTPDEFGDGVNIFLQKV